MRERGKAVVENRPCANCGLPLRKGRVATAKYCLRKPCRTEINKRWNKKSREKLKRFCSGSGFDEKESLQEALTMEVRT